MSIAKTPHDWSKDSLFSKAQRYTEEMFASDQDEWKFGFWSALTLEILIRASVANISPVLLADGREWANLLYAVGFDPNIKKFNPKSADINNALACAQSMFADFTAEMLNFCVSHLNRRNSELHSGALPFDSLGTSNWLPMYCCVCECLVNHMGESLDTLFGPEAAKTAVEHIQALKDEAAKAVKQSINAHKTIWDDKSPEEKESLTKQAEAMVNRYHVHRVACPACNCNAALHGTPSGLPKTQIDDTEIVERQAMLPSSFECIACALKISGYSKLVACGLGNTFTATSYTSPIEHFGIDILEEAENLMAEDNNEYGL